ncbi:MAG: hypothetical protein VB085_13820 [Peptococcaceae bacterium]|nr:hypothetical protein [Peptococcaceae bacterium]
MWIKKAGPSDAPSPWRIYPEAFHQGFFRFSVGLEDTEDIIEDIVQALKKTGL